MYDIISEKADIIVMIKKIYEAKENKGDFSLLNDQELQQIIEESKCLRYNFIDFNESQWIEWLNNENIKIHQKRDIEPWFFEYYKEKLNKINEFNSLKYCIAHHQGYITQEKLDFCLKQIEFKLIGHFYDLEKKQRYWNYVYYAPVIQDVLSKLVVISQQDYNEYVKKTTSASSKKKLTAPDLVSGAITCVILCCITFIFNYFWAYWIIIWIGYIVWRDEQIKKYNPQYFKKENENEKKNL